MSRLLLGSLAAACATVALATPAHAQGAEVPAAAPVTAATGDEAGTGAGPGAGDREGAGSPAAAGADMGMPCGHKGGCHACDDDGNGPDGSGSDMGTDAGSDETGEGKHHETEGGKHHGGRIRLDPHVLVQVQAALLAADQNLLERGDRAERPGFALRRARLGFTGGLGRRVTGGVEADLSRGADLMNEAWLGVRAWRSGQIVAGSHKVPFSRHALLGSGEQALADRPLAVQALAPFRQVGVTAHGSYDFGGLAWWLGAANGFDRTPNFYAGVRENEGLKGNRTGGLTFAARVQTEPLGRLGRSVADVSRGPFRLEFGAGALLSQGGATDSLSMSTDVHVKVRGFHLLAEALWDRTSPQTQPTATGGLPDTVRREALVVEAGYAWWRLHTAARVELIDADTGIEDNRDEAVLSYAVGYQLPGNRLRVLLQFDSRMERFVPQVANDTLFAQAQLQL